MPCLPRGAPEPWPGRAPDIQRYARGSYKDRRRLVTANANTQREHHWDALRALLMLLGIPYHVALTYQLGEGQMWIVNAHEGVAGFTEIAQFIHIFRMPVFFAIAGYFTALLLARRAPGTWLKGRLRRLAIPLAISLVTLSPLLNIACELSNFSLDGALKSWVHNSSQSGGYWVRHLWFLIVLLYYSAIAAMLVAAFPRLAGAVLSPERDSRWARRFTIFWFAVAALVGAWQAVSIELFYMAGLATNVPQQIFRLDEALQYLPYYLLGAFLARAPRITERIYRVSSGIAVAAAVSAGLAMLYATQLWPPYGRFVKTIAAICLMQPILLIIRHIADRPSAIVSRLVDASFVIYLFHLPVLAWLVVLFIPVALPVALKALLVMALTLLLSWGAWEIVSRSPTLRLLYDGVLIRGSATREMRKMPSSA